MGDVEGKLPEVKVDVIVERRAQLLVFTEEARLNGMLEQHLLDSLRAVREARARADGFVQAIVKEGEERHYSPEQWRLLLGGLEEKVAASAGREACRVKA